MAVPGALFITLVLILIALGTTCPGEEVEKQSREVNLICFSSDCVLFEKSQKRNRGWRRGINSCVQIVIAPPTQAGPFTLTSPGSDTLIRHRCFKYQCNHTAAMLQPSNNAWSCIYIYMTTHY
jgi:hypothetical protein